MRLLEGLNNDSVTEHDITHTLCSNIPSLGVGMDCSITPIKQGLSLVQTTDFFYPLIDDPYMMGKITCANVLSDLYAMGIIECDNMLMLLGIPIKMTEKERDVVIPLMIKGFKEAALEAGTFIKGGHTILNPWCIMGGVATSICIPNEFILPDNAVVGDVLVLTKPLGIQVATKGYNLIMDSSDLWSRVKLVMTKEEIIKGYKRAMNSMARLNKNAARLMHKYNAHAATDVTGFGILGHAQNLVRNQKNEVSFVIHNLPIIWKMVTLAKAYGGASKLLKGLSPETSGGLLICLPREQATAYCRDIEKEEGYQAWIIGIVERGNREARIIDKPRIIEVPNKEKNELW